MEKFDKLQTFSLHEQEGNQRREGGNDRVERNEKRVVEGFGVPGVAPHWPRVLITQPETRPGKAVMIHHCS